MGPNMAYPKALRGFSSKKASILNLTKDGLKEYITSVILHSNVLTCEVQKKTETPHLLSHISRLRVLRGLM